MRNDMIVGMAVPMSEEDLHAFVVDEINDEQTSVRLKALSQNSRHFLWIFEMVIRLNTTKEPIRFLFIQLNLQDHVETFVVQLFDENRLTFFLG